MMKKTMMIAATVCVLGLSGCGKSAGTAPSASAAASNYAVKAVAVKTDEKVEFSVDLPPDCIATPAGAVVASVNWKIRDPGLKKVRIMVGKDLASARLFSEAGASGTEKTGPWTQPGISFFLQDDAGQLLGLITMETKPCAK